MANDTMLHKEHRKGVSRRQFLTLSAATVGAGLLAACTAPITAPTGSTGEETAAAENVQVVMWAFPLTSDDTVLFEPMQQAFAEANPTITVQVQIEPWNGRENKMVAALAAGNPPNAVYLNPDFYPKFVDGEALVALDEFLEGGFRDDFLEGALSAVTYENKTFGLPILTSAYTQAFNRDLIEAAGIEELPTDWVSFRAAVETVHDPDNGVWGARYDLDRPSTVTTFVPFLRMAGGEQFTEDGSDIAFDSEAGLEALDYLVGFYREGLVQESNINGGGIPFSSGQVGFLIQTENNALKQTLLDNPDMNVGVTPVLTYKEQSNFGTVGSYAVFAQTENHEETAKWLAFVTNPENTLTILQASGFISPRASITHDQYAEGVFAEIASFAPLMRSEPKHVFAREVMAAQVPEFEAAYLGSKSVEQAMADAATAARAILAG
jgi:multiple sugar transport system substrate-binding protein